MVKVSISDSSTETGTLLVDYLKARKVYDPKAQATVCYGTSYGVRGPALNSACMSDKVKRMILMGKEGVSLVPWFRAQDARITQYRLPLLARKLTGHGGTDIVPVLQAEELQWRITAGWDWFSEFIPTQTEYRVWTFRGECLGVYEKVMRRPGDFKYIGRNFRNGFEFIHRKDASKDAIQQGVLATKALGLDFAAIDMLRGTDGKIYILEANTAPGVIRSGAQATLGLLADRISDWVKDGYPSL